MTSQPPPPAGGPGQPEYGSLPPQQQPPAQQQPGGHQPPQQPWGQQPPPQQQPWGQQPQNTHGRPGAGAGTGVSFDPKRLKLADYLIAGGTLLYLVLSWFTWYHLGGDEFFGLDLSVSGWTGSGNVKFAFLLFLLATVWALLPAVTELKVGFPRSWVTVGLTALGFLLTLFAWFDTFDFDFSIWALLGLLTAAALLAVAVLSLLLETRRGGALPGPLSAAAQWADRPAPGAGHGGPGRPGQGTYGQGAPQQSQPWQPPAAPPQGTPPPPPPPAGPGQPGGPA